MERIKAYYKPGTGYLLYMPDGTQLPGVKALSISEEVIEVGSRGGNYKLPGEVTANVILTIKIVNEEPIKPKP